MIAPAKPAGSNLNHLDCDTEFEAMLPQIKKFARRAFGYLHRELRDELIAEVVAHCFVAFRRLVARGKMELAYPTVLAGFAVKQVRAGRRVGGRLNIRDITSRHCQIHNGVRRRGLGDSHRNERLTDEVALEDKTTSPADLACFRIDFAAWMESLDRRTRSIAQTLATSETTKETADKFGVSAGRVSQIRRELEQGWRAFQGEG